MSVCVHGAAAMDWHPIQDVFLPDTQYFPG